MKHTIYTRQLFSTLALFSLMVLSGGQCSQETSSPNRSNQDTSNQDTSNQDTSNQDTSNQDTSNQDTSNQDTSNQDTSNQDTSNQDTSSTNQRGATQQVASTEAFINALLMEIGKAGSLPPEVDENVFMGKILDNQDWIYEQYKNMTPQEAIKAIHEREVEAT